MKILIPGSGSPARMSGTPFFFLQAMKAAGQALGHDVMATTLPRMRELPLATAAWCVAKGGAPPRAFMLSSEFLDASMGRGWGEGMDEADLIIIFGQTLPKALMRSSRQKVVLVVDLTLRDYFENYPELANIPPRIVELLIEQERAAYRRADIVACHTSEAARDLMERYGLPSDKVVMFGRGVNWTGPLTQQPPRLSEGGPINLGLIGVDVFRKGIHQAVAGMDRYREQTGTDLRLIVMGASSYEPLDRSDVEYAGRISKDADPDRFIDYMEQVHVGVLLSQAEGSPGSVYEFLYFGRPVVVSRECNMDARVLNDDGFVVSDRDDPDQVASAIHGAVTRLRTGGHPQIGAAGLTWGSAVETLLREIDARLDLPVFGREHRDLAAPNAL